MSAADGIEKNQVSAEGLPTYTKQPKPLCHCPMGKLKGRSPPDQEAPVQEAVRVREHLVYDHRQWPCCVPGAARSSALKASSARMCDFSYAIKNQNKHCTLCNTLRLNTVGAINSSSVARISHQRGVLGALLKAQNRIRYSLLMVFAGRYFLRPFPE